MSQWQDTLSDAFYSIEKFEEPVMTLRCSDVTWEHIQHHMNLGDSDRLWTARRKRKDLPDNTFEVEGLYGTLREGSKN